MGIFQISKIFSVAKNVKKNVYFKHPKKPSI